jgi:hypothetical protein
VNNSVFSLLFGQIERNASSNPHNSFCQQKTFLPCWQYRQGKNPESLRHCSREFALPAFFPPLSFAAALRPQIHPALSGQQKILQRHQPARWHTVRGSSCIKQSGGMRKKTRGISAPTWAICHWSWPFVAVSILLFQCSS